MDVTLRLIDMSIEDVVLSSVGEFIALVVNFVLRMFGFPEQTAQKIVDRFVCFIFFIFIAGLLYITFKYS